MEGNDTGDKYLYAEDFRKSQEHSEYIPKEEEMDGSKEGATEDKYVPPKPIVLSEKKTLEATERETTKSETHGNLDTKVTENICEQKEQASRTEVTHDGIRVVKEESVEAMKVVRETSVTEKQIRTADGELKSFSDEPLQTLFKRYTSDEQSFNNDEFNEAAVDVEVSHGGFNETAIGVEVSKNSFNEAAIDVPVNESGFDRATRDVEGSTHPEANQQQTSEKYVKVEVVGGIQPSEHVDEDLGTEVKVTEDADDVTDKDESDKQSIPSNSEDETPVFDTSLSKDKKSPRSGLFSFFKRKSDKDQSHREVDERLEKPTAKEKKREGRESKDKNKKEKEREEKERKQHEKEEKERKKKEEKERKKHKGKNKDRPMSEDRDNKDVSPARSPSGSESASPNKGFSSSSTDPECESHSVHEEPLTSTNIEKAPREIPVQRVEDTSRDREKEDISAISESQEIVNTSTLNQDASSSFDANLQKGDKRAHTLSVSSDHREELIQVEEPKSFTLPRTTKPSKDEPEAEPFISTTPQTSTSQMLAPFHSPDISFDGAINICKGDPMQAPSRFVVVAIDFGTTFSGYAFSFTRDPESIHMMRKWEGGDPGVINQKTPTTLLLYPDGSLHSFGYTARDRYHDLDSQEAKKWLYFEKFKMVLHHSPDLNKETTIKAANGKEMPALTVFSHALKFFKDHALQELSDQSSIKILNEDVKWVITVPAIWKAPAKQFMRTAAYNAGIASPEYPEQLTIALEPEAASIYVRRLRMHQLVPEKPLRQPLSPRKDIPHTMNMDRVSDEFRDGTRYMIVDCGGGTVDMTVHEMDTRSGKLKELYKATGGPYGSVGVDMEFEKLLIDIFGIDFIEAFKVKRPVGWVDLMIAFESRKRAANPFKPNPLNVALPFSFIDYYKKFRGSQVDSAIKKYKDPNIRWSTQGMLRLNPEAMKKLFVPTVENIKIAIGDVLNNPVVKDIKYMFLVGGFAESPMLQQEVRNEFGHLVKMIIPQDVTLTILKGAVLFGLDPTVVNVRRSRMTYGVGVLNRFIHGKHPVSKMVRKDGIEWCTDVFDKFVVNDQSVALGDTVLRSYTPAKPGQKSSVINIYCSESSNQIYITENGVIKCGTLCLDLTDVQYQENIPKRREIQTRMMFGDTEIKISALDVTTGKCVRAAIDFLT